MVNSVELVCPHCAHTSELFISETVNYIVLNCPSCSTPLLFQGDHWIAVSRQIARQISTAPKDAVVDETLSKIMKNARNIPQPFKYPSLIPENHVNAQVTDTSRQPLSQDDILNLRIDLEQIEDSMEFIARM